MAEREYVTVETLLLREENLTLKFTAQVGDMLDSKFDELHTSLDTANIERRDSAINEVTGFTWDDRAKTRKAVQHAYDGAVKSDDTRGKIKSALISWGLPASIVAAIGWFMKHMPTGNIPPGSH